MVATPLASKKHRGATRKVARQIEVFYTRAFPGSMAAPDVFWSFIREKELELGAALLEAGENNGAIQRACTTFVGLFKKACVRARKLIDDDQQTGDDGSQGGTQTRGEAARQALEDAQRPEDYLLW